MKSTDPLLPSSSNDASNGRRHSDSESSTSSNSNRTTPPPLASHLAVAIAMTLGLILLNANYSFRSTKGIGTSEEYQRLASLTVLPSGSKSSSNGSSLDEQGGGVLPQVRALFSLYIYTSSSPCHLDSLPY